VTYEWMAGGFFVLQRVDINHVGLKITGTEYIGYDESNYTLKSYIFGNTGPSPFGGPSSTCGRWTRTSSRSGAYIRALRQLSRASSA
jgi:hypothetical protein